MGDQPLQPDFYALHPHSSAALPPYAAAPGYLPGLPYPALPHGPHGPPSDLLHKSPHSAFSAAPLGQQPSPLGLVVGDRLADRLADRLDRTSPRSSPPPRRRRPSASSQPSGDSNHSDSGSDAEEMIDVVKSAFQQVRPAGLPVSLSTPLGTPPSPTSPSLSRSSSRSLAEQSPKRPRSPQEKAVIGATECHKSPAIRPSHQQHKHVWRPY